MSTALVVGLGRSGPAAAADVAAMGPGSAIVINDTIKVPDVPGALAAWAVTPVVISPARTGGEILGFQ